MTIAEQIAADQRAALECVRRVAESLPGFTFPSESDTLDGEAETPGAGNSERLLTPNRPS